jgi:hypothetical protein
MLSDFFVATPAEALRYANRIDEADDGEEIERLLQPAQYKGITGLEIGTLWAILEGREWDAEKHMPADVCLAEDGEIWLHRFPAELSQLLAHLDGAALKVTMAAWAATEELDCSPEDLKPVLEDLRSLARQAGDNGKSVYLWGCL